MHYTLSNRSDHREMEPPQKIKLLLVFTVEQILITNNSGESVEGAAGITGHHCVRYWNVPYSPLVNSSALENSNDSSSECSLWQSVRARFSPTQQNTKYNWKFWQYWQKWPSFFGQQKHPFLCLLECILCAHTLANRWNETSWPINAKVESLPNSNSLWMLGSHTGRQLA